MNIIKQFLAISLMGLGVWSHTYAAATSAPFRLETRESFGGRLAYGQALFSVTTDGMTTGSVMGAGSSGGFTVWSGGTNVPIWNTALQMDGWYDLTLSIGTNSASTRVALLNGQGVRVQEGTLTNEVIWSSNIVQVVRHWVVVPSGKTLTIPSGTIVKFCDDTGIQVNPGGALNVTGATLTHIADDTVGGDTNMDGSDTQPISDKWKIFGTGQINLDAMTAQRWKTQIVTEGTLTGSQIWFGNKAYHITGNLTVAAGATLTIQPGAIVKFATNTALIVNSGGALNAAGTRAQPIVFTSIKDDTYGGDTNGDGSKTRPQPGDWVKVGVNGGTARMEYISILYSSKNATTGAINMNGGQVTLVNSIIAHGAYDAVGVESGNFYMTNSIIYDCLLAFRHWPRDPIVNCVIYDCGRITQGGGQNFVNCSFVNITDVYEAFGWASSYRFCNFYNSVGIGPQSAQPVGSNGNIWGDPRFVDAVNGDFRLMAGSPLIDAGDGTTAPERDYYGQPRMDVWRVLNTGTPSPSGACPDIGIYEYPGIGAGQSPDLKIISVSGPAAARAGETVELTYEVENVGDMQAVAPWRDTFTLQAAEESLGGQVIALGDVVTGATISPRSRKIIKSRVAIPSVKTGQWRFAVTANSYRDLFESDTSNNRTEATGSLTITLPTLGSGTSNQMVGSTSSVGFELPGVTAAGAMVLVSAPSQISVYGAHGYVPTAANFDWKGVDLGDGRYLIVFPAVSDARIAYLCLDNVGPSAAVRVEVLPLTLRLFSVNTKKVLNRGTATLTLTGAGLSSTATVALKRGSTVLQASTVSQLSLSQLSCEVPVEKAIAGMYDVVVTVGSVSATLPGAVELFSNGIGAKLEASLVLPNSVRDGRFYTGWVEYRNAGDADMLMPVFEVKSTTGTQMGDTLDQSFTNAPIYLAGISPTYPAGVLKAGEANRVPFYFRPIGSYSLVLSTFTLSNTVYPESEFSTRQAYAEAMSLVTTRLNLRGRDEWRMSVIIPFELDRLHGRPVCAISGILRHASTQEPLVGVSIRASCVTNSLIFADAITDASGYYQLAGLPNGTYAFSAEHAQLGTTNPVTIASSQDINGFVLYALPSTTVAGSVKAKGTGVPLESATILLRYSDGRACQETSTDVDGKYRFAGVFADTYTVTVLPVSGYVGAIETNLIVVAQQAIATANFELEKGGVLTGTVTFNDSPVTNGGAVQVVQDDGTYYSTACQTNGIYRFDGLPAQSYEIRFVSNDYLSESNSPVTMTVGSVYTNNLRVLERPVFFPERMGGEVPFTTAFHYAFPEKSGTISSWQWDFDNDGIIDSTEAYPTHTYTSVGSYTVKLIVESTNGVFKISVAPACVTVRDKIGNALNANAFIVEQCSGLAFISKTDSTLTLSGTPPFAIVPGTIICGEADGGYLRKVVSITQVGAQWILQTEDASMGDLYETYSFSCNGPIEKTTGQSFSRVQLASDAGETKGLVFVEGGVSGNIDVSPTLYFDFEANKIGGKEYLRMAVVGKVEIEAQIGVSGTLGTKINKEIELPLTVPVPTAVFGLTLEPKFTVGIEGALQGTAEATFKHTESLAVKIGAERIDGKTKWLSPFSAISTNEASGDINGSASVRIYAKPMVAAKWLKVISIEAGPELYEEIKYSAGASSPAELSFTAGAGVVGEAFVGDSKTWFAPKLSLLNIRAGVISSKWTWEGPSPDFSCSPEFGDAPLTSFFSDQSEGWTISTPAIHAKFGVDTYNWNFGDGTAASLADSTGLTHTYLSEGVYVARLKVRGGPINNPIAACEKRITVGKTPSPSDTFKPKNSGSTELPFEQKGQGSGVPQRSFDPNEMAGPQGAGDPETQRFVQPGQWMDYIVYFENKTNATAAAQEVYVDAILSPYLDWATLELGEICFNNQTEMGLAGKQGGTMTVDQQGADYQVQATFSLDRATGKISWYLRSYDPTQNTTGYWPEDVEAGFLPPNDDTHRGEGHLAYRVKVRADAPRDVRIDASAEIIFDHNAMIPTDPSWWNIIGPVQAYFSSESTTVSEADGNVVLPVFGGSVTGISSVAYWVMPGTATAGSDYTPPATQPQRVVWTNTMSSRTITIPVKTDTLVEDDETFYVLLGNPVNCQVGEPGVCKVTITDVNRADTLADALDNVLLTWTTGGTPAWVPQSTVTSDGEDAAASGAMASNKVSYVQTTVTGTGTLSFAWSVAGKGTLRLYDGKSVLVAITNTTVWQNPTFTLTSNITHTLKWEFTQGSDSSGRAYLDQVVWIPGGKTGVTVTAIANNPEGGTVTGTGIYYAGAKVPLNAKPRLGWLFTGWTPTNLFAKPLTATQTLTVSNSAITVTANFTRVPVATGLPNPPEGGSVTGSGRYTPGLAVSLAATPVAGFGLKEWTDNNGNPVSISKVMKFTMPSQSVTYTANFMDIQKPVVAITLPTVALRVSNAVCTVKGTASDNSAVTGVFCRVNSGVWTNAITTNSWKNWSVPVTLTAGSNLVQAYSADSAGNISATSSVSCTYVVLGSLTVMTNGVGTVTRAPASVPEVNQKYTLTAAAGIGSVFLNWTGGVTSTAKTISFVMTSNMTISANFADTSKPTVVITYPANNAKVMTNGLVIIRGTAADNGVLSEVKYQLRTGDWTNAVSTNIFKAWTAPYVPAAGLNTSKVYSVDMQGNHSTTSTVVFTYIPGAVLTVQTNLPAGGTITPSLNGKVLQIGSTNTMTAAAKAGYVFTNWTYGIGGSVVTNGKAIKFVMTTNLVLTANFRSLTAGDAVADVLATLQAAIVVDGSSKDWTDIPRSAFSYSSVTQEVAVSLDGNNIALLLTGCPFNTSDTVLVYFKLRLTYGEGDNRHTVDLWTSGSVLYGMVDGQVIAGLEAVLLNGVLEVKIPVEQSPSQVTIEEVGCGMNLGGTMRELFKLTPPPTSTL